MQTYNLTCEYLYLCHFTLQKTARQALTTGLDPQVSTLILYSKYGHFDFTHGREGVFFPLQIKPRATRRLSKCCVTELHHEPNNICNLNPKVKKKKSFDPKPHKTLHALFRMEAFKAQVPLLAMAV